MSLSVEEFILNVVQQIEGNVQNAAQQATLDTVLAATNAVLTVTQQNAAALNNDIEQLFIRFNQLSQQISQLNAPGNLPVNLPPVLPPVSGVGDDTIYNQVWLPPDSFGVAPISYVFTAGWLGFNIGQYPGVVFPDHRNPFFYARRIWNSPINHVFFDDNLDLFNTSDLFAHGSLLGWLNFHKGTTWSVNADFDVGRYYVQDLTQSSGIDNQMVTSITESEWRALAGLTGAAGAPVWPGLANVTLGTSVALSDGLVVTGPLDGLIFTITAVPPPTGFYPFGTHKSFVHVGAVVFVDDNGQLEQSHSIGLDTQVVTPESMFRASSAIIRLKSGTVGTVQPWITA